MFFIVRDKYPVSLGHSLIISAAVRADYFAGTGPEAGLLAARVNQPLRLWVLWPK